MSHDKKYYVNLLKSKVHDVDDIFKTDPYDITFNWQIEDCEELFTKLFFVSCKEYTELTIELKKNIEDSNRVVFLNGYAGTGKTTFIRYFMKRQKNYEHIYYDFQEKPLDYSNNSDKAVIQMINRAIKAGFPLNRKYEFEEDKILSTFAYLYQEKDALMNYELITRNTYNLLNLVPNIHLLQFKDVELIMDGFDLKDVFTCFYIHLFIHSSSGRKKVVYFDNLDVAAIEYISTRFLEFFDDSIATGTTISTFSSMKKYKVDFYHDFRFVFCFRDENDAQINEHAYSRISVSKMLMTTILNDDFYLQVLEKRLQIARKIFSKRELTNRGYNSTFLSESIVDFFKNDYFNYVFLPLYNYNFRLVTSAILKFIKEYQISFENNNIFGNIGILMYGFIGLLISDNFLQDYVFYKSNYRTGYCFLNRVLLTVLINRCDYRHSAIDNDGSAYELEQVIRDLKVFYEDVDEILTTIGKSFLYYKKNWAHLITLLNTRISSNTDLVERYSRKMKNYFRHPDSDESTFIRNELNRVKIRINPAGFVYVRYLLTHFEFYAHRVKNSTPLFFEPLKKSKNLENRFEFEEKINKVFSEVEIHVDSMNKYFKHVYLPNISIEEFLKSEYCLKHNYWKDRVPDEGYFFSTKIITTHIDYIDNFRRFILKNCDICEEEIPLINKLLLEKIEKYICLLEKTYDIKAKNIFPLQFRGRISQIEKSGFLNTDIRVQGLD